MKLHARKKNNLGQAGFITADFIFSFAMVIGCGILVFAITFSLMTIEVAQYIVWSSARAYSVGHVSLDAAKAAGQLKYKNLKSAFPLLTGENDGSVWFKMSDDNEIIIDEGVADSMSASGDVVDKDNRAGTPEVRHPWLGVESEIDLIIFKNINLPFLGRISTNPDNFKLKIRGILLRHPSVSECQEFYSNRFEAGIKAITVENGWNSLGDSSFYRPQEDNGC